MASDSAATSTFAPFPDFVAAARTVLDALYWRLGFGLWVVAVVEGQHHRVLIANDHRYGVREGRSYPWLDRYCWAMARGQAPSLAWDFSEASAYAALPLDPDAPVRALFGAPLVGRDGTVVGALCGLDPLPQTDDLLAEQPTLELLARLLATILLLGPRPRRRHRQPHSRRRSRVT
jgi:GAF domain-containing protein